MPFNLANTKTIRSIQKGSFTFTGSNTTQNDTIIAVIKNKSFLTFTYKNALGGPMVPDSAMLRGRINTGTTLTFSRVLASVGNNITVFWSVIEFTAISNVTVQHGSETLTGTGNNVSLSAINQSNAFPIITWQVSGGLLGRQELVRAQITSTTNLALTVTGTTSCVVDWQVINNPHWDVTEYTDTMLATETNINKTITAIDSAETMLIGSGSPTGGSGGLGGNAIPRFQITSSTNINIVRTFANFQFAFIFYVIKTNGQVAVQRDITESISNGTLTGTLAIASVTLAKSVVILQGITTFMPTNNSGTADNPNSMSIALEFNSSTEIGQSRLGSANQVLFALEVWDFSNT